MPVVRESLVAGAHASDGKIHVLVADELTPAESKALRKEMRAAEVKAIEFGESAGITNNQVHDIFSGILGGIVRVNLGGTRESNEPGEVNSYGA